MFVLVGEQIENDWTFFKVHTQNLGTCYFSMDSVHNQKYIDILF